MGTIPTERPKHDDRSWEEIATELSHESNSDKLAELATELNDALEKKEEKLHNGKAA